MLSKLKSHLILILTAMGAFLGLALKIVLGQKKKAQKRAESAEASLESFKKKREASKRAQKASDTAKEKGDAKVKKAVDNARAGNRDHFLSSCATRAEYVYLDPDLPLPDRPALPRIQPDALMCLSDDTYTILVERDAIQSAHIDRLEAIILSVTE
jgi:hypothetical protein